MDRNEKAYYVRLPVSEMGKYRHVSDVPEEFKMFTYPFESSEDHAIYSVDFNGDLIFMALGECP